MKKILLALVLVASFSSATVAGEIPHPIDCPPEQVCPESSSTEDPIEEADPEVDATTEVLAEVMVDAITSILGLI